MTVMNIPEVPPFQTDGRVDPPQSITVRKADQVMVLGYADGTTHELSLEFLRVYSPSAEVVGHGPGQEVLQVGKSQVGVNAIEPVGQYAIKPIFTDGHQSGLYSWSYLRWLGDHQPGLWADYLRRLEAAGASRDPQNEKA